MNAAPVQAAAPYRLFDVRVARIERVTPAMTRFTFAGPDVRAMKTCGPDHRIKIFFPDASGRAPALPALDWTQAYQALDPATRWPRRTYTIRYLRADSGEVDVDFVLHGADGPASAWAEAARVGDALQMIAPNRAFPRDPGGVEWRPPLDVADVLVIGDETALPAIAGIVEELSQMDEPPRTQAFVEIPSAEDTLSLPQWPSLELVWLPRDGGDHGRLMMEAARCAETPATAIGEALPAVDIDRSILWERGDASGAFYAWVAGEAGAVKAIRHLLIAERGLDRRMATLMGYWRLGRALD